MSKNRDLVFNFGDKVIRFRFEELEDIDIDHLLKIDYANLFAELVTFPVFVNKLGLLCADMDNEFQESKLNLTIYESKLREKLRKDLTLSDEKGKIKKPTLDEIDTAMHKDKVWKIKKRKMFKAEKEKEYMYSVYSSAKDKSKKLDKLSMSVRPGDIDEKLIQSQLNKVSFKIKEGLIKD